MEVDLSALISELKLNKTKTPRVILYCRSRNMCADLYCLFLKNLGNDSYYPPGAAKISRNRLFGMYHANTPPNNKEVIMQGMQKADGIIRIVFATVALGMEVNFVGLNRTIHYGAPASIEDYFQESGRAGRCKDLAKSTIYWKPSDAPIRQYILLNPQNAELAAVCHYLENLKECRRKQLLCYFDSNLKINMKDSLLCCDVCASKTLKDRSEVSSISVASESLKFPSPAANVKAVSFY